MTAKELRAAGQLWPEILTDAELREELDQCDPSISPIANRMLRAERDRRTLGTPLGAPDWRGDYWRDGQHPDRQKRVR